MAVKDDPSYVGHSIMSAEATSDTTYLYRAPKVCMNAVSYCEQRS